MLKPSCIQVSALLLLLVVTVSLNFSVLLAESQSDGHKDSNPKGHLEPFGKSGIAHFEIEERSDFPEPADFLRDYVQTLKPVKFSGVFKDTRAVRLWTDDYLLKLDIPRDTQIQLETKKKENRSQETTAMHFHDFLKIYNDTEHYMVDDVPTYLRPDLNVPCSLQCPEIVKDGFAFALMWFSSGGTKSVVHTDAFDNINCLIRGQKTFVMLDPKRDRNKIDIGHHGAFSKVDVDRVDLHEYPGLAEAEFYHVNMTAGDCLFIPYRWIHQVRSFNSNVAVNFWWDHYFFNKSEPGEPICDGPCDRTLTLESITIHGIDSALEDFRSVRDWLIDSLVDDPMSLQDMTEMFKMSFDFSTKSEEEHNTADKMVKEVFQLLDLNKDEMFSMEDTELIPEETWEKVRDLSNIFTDMFEEMRDYEQLKAEREEYAKWEAERREEL